MNLARGDCEEKGLLSRPKTKEVDEDLELKQIWEEEGVEEGKSSQNEIDAGNKQKAGCWVSFHISRLLEFLVLTYPCATTKRATIIF